VASINGLIFIAVAVLFFRAQDQHRRPGTTNANNSSPIFFSSLFLFCFVSSMFFCLIYFVVEVKKALFPTE